jgi:hypothetical protein
LEEERPDSWDDKVASKRLFGVIAMVRLKLKYEILIWLNMCSVAIVADGEVGCYFEGEELMVFCQYGLQTDTFKPGSWCIVSLVCILLSASPGVR